MPPALFVGNARALCPVLVGRSAPLQQQFLVPPPMGCVYAKQSSNSSLDCAVNSHPGKGEFGEIRNGKPKFNDGSFGSSSSSAAAAAREAERKRERYSFRMQANPPRYIEAEQVAAGWPAWLTAVAGEAIQGWIPRRADSFEKLDKVEQLLKIFKLCGLPSEEYWKKSKLPHATIFKPQQPYKRCIAETFKDFPLTALALVETLLAIEASCRGTAAAALKSEFFTTKPLACDPSSLPKYPPSKEFDIKIRDEEARRRKAAAGRGRGSEVARRALRESRAVPAPDGNAELAASMQKRHLNFQGPSKSKSEKFNSQHDDGAIGFPIDPPRPLNASVEKSDDAESPGPHPEPSYSGPLSAFTMNGFAQERNQNDHDVQMASVWHSARPSKSVMKPGFKMQGTYGPQPGLDSHKTVNSLQQHGHVDATNGVHEDKYKLSDLPEHSTKEEWRADSLHGVDAFHFQDFSRSHFQRVDRLATKEPVMGSANEGDRVEYSGPLLSQSANIDEILEKHERQIQQAVRRARQEKWKAHKNNSARGRKKAVEQKSWISTANGSKDVGHN